MALRHQERTALAGRLDGEGGPVDEAHPGGDRVDPEAVPRQVDEGDGKDDIDRHPLVVTEHDDGPLGHEGFDVRR